MGLLGRASGVPGTTHTVGPVSCFAKLWHDDARTQGVGSALEQPPAAFDVARDAEIDDSELVAATLAGRSNAFGMLVERYERAVYHLCLRTMQEREEARDCAQDAFYKAYRSLRTFKAGARFSTWIFAIAYHACCDRLAHRRRHSDCELPDRADPAPGPAQLAERSADTRALYEAIEALPEKYRRVITLYHLQGKQYGEIASVLGMPMGTVKTHLFRAKDLLRQALVTQ